MGQTFGCVSYLQITSPELTDKLLADLLDLEENLIINMHLRPIDPKAAIKSLKSTLSNIQKMKIEEQKKAVRSGYDMDIIPTDISTYGEDVEGLLNEIQSRNEKLFELTFLLMNTADNKRKLDNIVYQTAGIAQKYNCNIRRLQYQQEQGLVASLPLGMNQTGIQRIMTTTSTAIFVPFTTQELFQGGEALYYGLNALSNNLIMVDRKRLKTPNGLILGTPGSGKSFATKREILNVFLITDDDIIICDPEGEYFPLVNALNGEVIKISAKSNDYINPMEVNLDVIYHPEKYRINGDVEDIDTIIADKAEFITSFCEVIMKKPQNAELNGDEVSMIDLCVKDIYKKYLYNDPKPENMPTLQDFYERLNFYAPDKPAAQNIANSLQLYVTGSQNVFNHRSNVDTQNRVVCFDIRELGTTLRKAGMLIVQHMVWTRVSQNRSRRKSTRYYVDEFHLLLNQPQTANYSIEMWKRFRKWGGIITGISQNVTDFLGSLAVESIVGNSDFILMLNQHSGDQKILAEKLNISKHQISTNRKKGKQKYSRKTIKTYQEVDKAARKQEAERQNKIPKDSVYTKKTNEEQKAKVKYHLYFDKKTGKTDGKKKTLSSVPKKALKNAVYQKAGEDEEENSAVDAAHKLVRSGEWILQEHSSRNIRKNRSQIHKENRLEQRAWKSASRYQYQKYLEEHPEMQKKLIRKLIQKQRIKREYQMAYRAGKIAKETKDTSIRSVNLATKIARKAQEVFVRNVTTLISMGLLLILLLSVMTGFASCSAMFSNGISTVIASSYIADPDEIEKAELYYTQLEASLQQKINQMEARYPGKDEYRYNIGEIGHDPHTLISYLTARYGDFKFEEIKGELETIFSLQYGITIEEKSETRQETSTIQVGQSLGNVVTSGYCNCPICCGVWSGGPTASGAMPQANHTLAVDAANPFLPIGTKVVMNGIEYTVEDTGNFAQYGVQFDVYYDNHAVAEAHGHQTWECFLAEGNQNSVEVTRTVTADVLNVSVQAKPLRSVILSRMEEDEQEIYEEVYSNRGNLQTYKTPVELNWYAYISTYYGYSVNNGTGQTQLHRGVTVNVRQGTEVKSAMNGFVVDVGYSGTFGNYVVTQDKKGVQIKYAYLQSISVANGQEVTTDTVIGTTGSTGSATGSQLYLELVKDGEYYNPVFYISTGDSGLYGGGGSYDDETVRRLFAEADKYLGMPYVWGGSSPETSFDCSGFVSYVFTNSGVCNMGRLTAQGIYDICMPVSPEEARPGDIIFFTGTYDAGEPVTHVGIYAGDGQMIHCGNPIQYTSINSAYWQSHFYAFGRP